MKTLRTLANVGWITAIPACGACAYVGYWPGVFCAASVFVGCIVVADLAS